MAQSETDKANAAAIVAGWAWQPAEGHNYRFEHATNTLTRFYESASMQPDEIKLVIEYLREQEIGADGISLMNRLVDLGSGWKAKDAWYQTSESSKFANTDSTRIRVYQVLFQAPDGIGDGPYEVENGCQYLVSHTFYWDVEQLPAVPAASSGVEYRLEGVSRDRETGLFSAVLEKRERVQQDVAEYVTGQTAFSTTKDEQHIGVKQDNVAATGKQASVSSGTIVRRKVTKNADCTSNVENETTVEKPVTGAVVEYRKTLRGTVERRIDRSQGNPLNSTGLKIGELRRSEKTDGMLWNNEIQKSTAEPVGEVADSCARTALTHTDVKVENVPTKPTIEQQNPGVNQEVKKEARLTDENTWDVSTTHIVYTPKDTGVITSGSSSQRVETKVGVNQTSVPAGGQGGVNVIRRISASPNEHGSFSTNEETTTFIPDSKTATGGTTSRTVTVESGVNQTAVPADSPAVNKEVDVSVSLNDHGSMSTQKRVTTYQPDKKTATGGTTSRTVTVESGVNQTAVPTDTPAVNKEVEVSVSLNDHGSMSTQKRTIVYQPDSKTATGGTTSRTVTVESGVNQTAVPADSPAVNKEVEVSVSLNDHGSMSTQKRVTNYLPDSKTATGGTTSRTVTVESGVNQTEVPTESPAVNKEVEVSVSLNDHGSMSTQKRVTTYTKQGGGGGGSSGGGVTTTTTTVTTNDPDGSTAAPASDVNKVVDLDVTPNDHGSYTRRQRTTTYTKRAGGGGGSSGGGVTTTTTTVTTNDPNGNTAAPASSVNKVVDLDVTPNDHGSYTRRKRTTTYIPKIKTDINWSDNNADYSMAIYRNRQSPMIPPGSHDHASAHAVLNDHGSFDGSWIVKDDKDDGSGRSLAWSIGPRQVKAQYYYMKNGRMYKREFTGTVYLCYGRANHVANELYGDGNATSIPQIGWITQMGTSLYTTGQKYTLTSVGAETLVGSNSSSQSN